MHASEQGSQRACWVRMRSRCAPVLLPAVATGCGCGGRCRPGLHVVSTDDSVCACTEQQRIGCHHHMPGALSLTCQLAVWLQPVHIPPTGGAVARLADAGPAKGVLTAVDAVSIKQQPLAHRAVQGAQPRAPRSAKAQRADSCFWCHLCSSTRERAHALWL